MKPDLTDAAAILPPDLELTGGCLACGGDLSVRLRPGSSRGVCRACGCWSSPHLIRSDDGLHIRHLAGGVA